jgi:hypothetical protein
MVSKVDIDTHTNALACVHKVLTCPSRRKGGKSTGKHLIHKVHDNVNDFSQRNLLNRANTINMEGN